MKKLIVSFMTLALAAAFAASGTMVQLASNMTIAGAEVKAGEYKVSIEGTSVTFKSDRKTYTLPGTTSKSGEKFRYTSLESEGNVLKAIHLGGTDTTVMFPTAVPAGGN